MSGYFQAIFSKLKISHFLILGTIFILAVAVRFSGLDKQMTHVDDIGVAWAILVQTGSIYDSEYVSDKINDSSHEDYTSPQFRFLRKLESAGRLESQLPFLRSAMKFFIIPQSFTYGPFQFFLTSLLISLDQDYRDLLFWGRWPSFIFAILALILIVFAALRLEAGRGFLAAAAGLSLLGFSWENIIYSRHMSSYAIGIFAALLIIILLIEILIRQPAKIKQGVIVGFFLAIAVSMQYQAIYFLPAFFLIWFSGIFRLGLKNIHCFAAAVFSSAIFILPLSILFILPQAHVAGEMFLDTAYHFQLPPTAGFWAMLGYIAEFFIGNLFEIFRFVMAIVPAGSWLDIFIGITLILFFIGLIRMFFSGDDLLKKIGLFFAFSFLTVIVLAAAGRIPLSPTRHSLIFLPYLALIVSLGISWFFRFLAKRLNFDSERIVALSLSFLLIACFFSQFKTVSGSRRDFFGQAALSEIIEEYNPRFAVAADQNLFFMVPFKDWRQYRSGRGIYNIFENTAGAAGIYLLISQSPMSDYSCGKMLEEAGSDIDCQSGSLAVLLRKDFDSGATLDLFQEAHQIKNQLFVRVIKI